jgi:hypothetical protein
MPHGRDILSSSPSWMKLWKVRKMPSILSICLGL